MRVRRAGPGDAEGIAETIRAVGEEPEDWILTEPPMDVSARAAAIRAEMAGAGNASWVLVEAGEILGSAAVWAEDDGALHLGMGIVRAARGRGLGGALLDAALAHATAEGRRVVLEVFASNDRAIGLYTGRGFMVTEQLPQHFARRDGSRRDGLRMRWSPGA